MSIVVSAPKRLRGREAHLRSADDDHLAGTPELREDGGREPHRAGALDENGVTELDVAEAHGVQRGRHAAARRQEGAPVERGRERDDVHARPEVDVLGPATEEPFVGRQRDAVDLARRAPGRRVRDRAVPAPPAVPVDVEERDDLPGPERLAVDVEHRSLADLVDHADADVARDDRVRDARQLTPGEVDVGAAHLASQRLEQDASGLEARALERAHLHRCPWCGEDCGGDHGFEVARLVGV